MFVSTHAAERIRVRLGIATRTVRGDIHLRRLESMMGEPGNVAIEVARFDEPITDDTGSNGDQLVAIARDGSVETVMLRRSSQPFTPAALSVDRVIKLTLPRRRSAGMR